MYMMLVVLKFSGSYTDTAAALYFLLDLPPAPHLSCREMLVCQGTGVLNTAVRVHGVL